MDVIQLNCLDQCESFQVLPIIYCTWLNSRSQLTSQTFDLNSTPVEPPYQGATIMYYDTKRSQCYAFLQGSIHILARINQEDISNDEKSVGLVLILSTDRTVKDFDKIIKEQKKYGCISLTEIT
uniref:AlNc14C1060G12747 protein n=1 Tax=Albugo laibachii Nc14 TaxID=890382 RepID=F0X2H0_9STRA|nr:AlNc14C1060G12747 [Albugo laibachii Nc14]|eukprot:CCA28067.1 AlNc14C1060G12747 [Albugo laibachii Nc14]